MTLLLLWWLAQAAPALDNDYVRVTRDSAPCAHANRPGCGDRVIVALGEIDLRSGKKQRKMSRGDIAVFKPGESYEAPMQLNRTRLQQWPDGQPEVFVDVVPDRVTFNPPVIHSAKNVGDAPLRGIVIEFKPERKKPR